MQDSFGKEIVNLVFIYLIEESSNKAFINRKLIIKTWKESIIILIKCGQNKSSIDKSIASKVILASEDGLRLAKRYLKHQNCKIIKEPIWFQPALSHRRRNSERQDEDNRRLQSRSTWILKWYAIYNAEKQERLIILQNQQLSNEIEYQSKNITLLL